MSDTLKLAVPTEGGGGPDATRSGHFGRAESFTVLDIADGLITGHSVIINGPHEHGGCGSIVTRLADAGVVVAVVAGMGGGPLGAMRACGMRPYFDGESPTPRTAVEAFLAGRLTPFGEDTACTDH